MRFLLLPVIGASSLVAASKLGLFPDVAVQPLLWFFLLTEFAMPSSQNIVVMIQLLDKPAAAARMAKTLLTIYAASAE